jgi:hypothetical protein
MVTGKSHRRIVTGHRNGKAVVLSDQRREPYKFKTVAGFEHTYMWSTNGGLESDPDKVEQELPKSALPPAKGSLLHIVTFPPASSATSSTSDPSQVSHEFLTRLPGLADTFERDGSQMHVTQTTRSCSTASCGWNSTTARWCILLRATSSSSRRRAMAGAIKQSVPRRSLS